MAKEVNTCLACRTYNRLDKNGISVAFMPSRYESTHAMASMYMTAIGKGSDATMYLVVFGFRLNENKQISNCIN